MANGKWQTPDSNCRGHLSFGTLPSVIWHSAILSFILVGPASGRGSRGVQTESTPSTASTAADHCQGYVRFVLIPEHWLTRCRRRSQGRAPSPREGVEQPGRSRTGAEKGLAVLPGEAASDQPGRARRSCPTRSRSRALHRAFESGSPCRRPAETTPANGPRSRTSRPPR